MSKSSKGGRRGGAMKGGRSSIARSRTGRTASMSGLAKGTASRAGRSKSLHRPDVYDALRRHGYSETKAAKISNAVANGTNGKGARGKAGGGRRGPSRKG